MDQAEDVTQADGSASPANEGPLDPLFPGRRKDEAGEGPARKGPDSSCGMATDMLEGDAIRVDGIVSSVAGQAGRRYPVEATGTAQGDFPGGCIVGRSCGAGNQRMGEPRWRVCRVPSSHSPAPFFRQAD